MPKVVCKFGGSSLKDEKALEKALSIIEKDSARRFIVVSAPGKRFASDEKTTDLFISAHKAKEKNDLRGFSDTFKKIRERFSPFACPFIGRELDEIETRLKRGESLAFAASRGEYLIAKIVAWRTGVPFLDSAEWLWIRRGKALKKSVPFLKRALTADRAVIPGFYGRGKNGLQLFPRGGGDITGGVVAGAIDADGYENWTDVNGVLSCDPKILPCAKRVERLSYDEIRKLFQAGANVLHGDSVLPIQEKNIPLTIGNTFDERGGRTLVCGSAGGRVGIAGLAVLIRGEYATVTAVDGRRQGNELKDTLRKGLQGVAVSTFGQGKARAFAVVKKEFAVKAVTLAHFAFFGKEKNFSERNIL